MYAKTCSVCSHPFPTTLCSHFGLAAMSYRCTTSKSDQASLGCNIKPRVCTERENPQMVSEEPLTSTVARELVLKDTEICGLDKRSPETYLA